MILIVGYGNPLRSDDAVGQQIAQVIEQRLRGDDVQVQSVYQLTPELIEPVSRAEFVIFIDARVGETPGLIIEETIQPQAGAGAFTHHLTPTTLLGVARDLYGGCPHAYCFTVTGCDFTYGEKLSTAVQAAVPVLCDMLQSLIKQYAKVEKEHV